MKKIFYCFLVLLLAVGFAAGNAMATSYDPSGKGGSLMTTPITPMLWNHGNQGDALFGELYRGVTIAQAGDMNFVTFMTIENTSDYWVAAHVRLRAGRYSIEVRDFPILLSPKDVFWMQYQPVTEIIDGEKVVTDIVLWSADTKTLKYSGLPVDANGEWVEHLDAQLIRQFHKLISDYAWDTYDIWEETTQGHLEVFGLYSFPTFDGVYDALATQNVKSIMAKIYGAIDKSNTQNCTESVKIQIPWNGGTDLVCSGVFNYLMGQVFLGDFSNGIYMGYPLRAIQNFRAGCAPIEVDKDKYTSIPLHRDEVIRGWLAPRGMIVYAPYESDAAYTDPDWATSFGPTWNDGDDWVHNEHKAKKEEQPYAWAVQSYSLDEVDDAIIKSDILGTYFNNVNNDTYTMAAVAFPTKYLHQFFSEASGLKGLQGIEQGLVGDKDKVWPVGQPGKASIVRKYLNVKDYNLQVALRFSAWDFEERPCGFSLSPYSNITFPWEVTFVPIGKYSQTALADFCFLILDDPEATCLDIDFPGGLWKMWNITTAQDDPRNFSLEDKQATDYSVMRNSPVSMLGANSQRLGTNLYNSFPASVLILDFNFYEYPHSRMLDPAWDNPPLTLCPTTGGN